MFAGLAIAWILTGAGGEPVVYYVGLFADTPASLVTVGLAAAAAHGVADPTLRRAWWTLTAALAVYAIGNLLSMYFWVRGLDPFPSVADLFYLAFYPLAFAAVLTMFRATALSVPWGRLALDAAILVLGFGTFFWFFVIRPAAGTPELDLLRQVVSTTYVSANCILLLAFGVVLMAGGGGPLRRRTLVLLSLGISAMFLADVVWALSKVGGDYLPGSVTDALYLACYPLFGAAACEQHRSHSAPEAAPGALGTLVINGLPYAAMFMSFLVLVYVTRGEAGEPATLMTIVIFVLAMLLMLRQGALLRDDAVLRERRAARLVELRYASLIANASDVIMIVDAGGRLRFASPAAERTFGLRPEQLVDGNLLDLWAGEDRERLAAFLAEVAATSGGAVGPVELHVARGPDRYTLEIVGSNLCGDPAVQGLALNFRDISERKALEEQLRQLAFHDPLTLLANRNLFRDRVQHAITLAQRGRQRIAVLFLDLDNFKNVNDTLGHDAGDRLLQAAAQRLAKCTRSSDTVARLGGDEFAILLEGVEADEHVERVAAAAIAALGVPFTLGGSEVRVAASVGVAFSTPDDGAEELLRNADIAMYNAKALGKDRYVVFQPEMQEVLRERLRVEEDIGRALATGEFCLEFQPIVDLGTRSLLGVEALVRWRHPERGVIMPARFIPVAEESGLIVALGRWVLLEACRSVRRWRDAVAGGAGLRVSINVSGRHLQGDTLVDDVARALAESGLEPGNLVIELTESTIMHNTEANLARLRQLKELGVRLAIDDFGTGYSSLSYLHRFPIDILKIDRSFVSRLTSDDDDGPELARAVVTLGETLGLDTVAEGVEHEEQVAALLALGCVAAQGYLFAPAATLEQLSATTFVARRNALWTQEAAREGLSATGRFRALKASGRRRAGIG